MKIYRITEKPISEHEELIGVQLIPPVYPVDISVDQYFHHMSKYFEQTLEILTPREVCIALAHLQVWKMVCEHGSPALVLEGDIEMSENELQAVKNLKLDDDSFEFIQLGWHPSVVRGEESFFAKSKSDSMAIGPIKVEILRSFTGAFAYYISKRAAQTLVESTENFLKRSDDWILHFAQSAFPIYFYGAFNHPLNRGEVYLERKSSPKVTISLLRKRICFSLKWHSRKLIAKLSLPPIKF